MLTLEPGMMVKVVNRPGCAYEGRTAMIINWALIKDYETGKKFAACQLEGCDGTWFPEDQLQVQTQ